MKYNSNNNSNLNHPKINNMITTVNLKIKDIHILLDDDNTKNINFKSKKSNSLKKRKNQKIPDLSHFSTYNSHKIYYHKRNGNSLRSSNLTMRNIPLNLKTNNIFDLNNMISSPSLSTTIDGYGYNNSSASNYIPKKNLARIYSESAVYYKKCKNNFSNAKNFVKKCNIKKPEYRNIYTSSKTNPFLLASGSPKNYINTKTFNRNDLINNDYNIYDNIYQNKTLRIRESKVNNIKNYFYISRNNNNKKIKFSYTNNSENTNNENIDNIDNKYFLLNVKRVIIIQKWWKNLKKKSILKSSAIKIQKVFRGYILRKHIKNFNANYTNYKNKNFAIKIFKNNNIYKYYYITKSYYKNNLPNIILLQREIRKFLLKSKIYRYYYFERSNILNFSFSNIINFLNQKQIIKNCYISKVRYKNKKNNTNNKIDYNNSNKNISFINKKLQFLSKNKINKKIILDKDNLKFLSGNKSFDSPNSLHSFFNEKNLNYNNMITIQTIDSKESQDFCKYDLFNRNKFDTLNKNNNAHYFLQNFFKNNIIHKLYLILLKMKYNYINLSNFISSIFNSIIKYKKKIFLDNLSLYYNYNKNELKVKRKENLLNIIIRNILVYIKNNKIKNEVIELIQKNLPQNIDINNINLTDKNLLFNISSELKEENFINTQIFKTNDNNLINYIYLFFKFEKNKNFINYNFIQNRLMKEPLKYRNIFTIIRYIDNLDDIINNKKICMNCFCKKNEKKCMTNCNCHYVHNIINGKRFNNIIPRSKARKSSLKKYILNNIVNNNKENNDLNIGNIIINKNMYTLELKNDKLGESDECQETESLNKSNNISENNIVNEIHIKKAFNYFEK